MLETRCPECGFRFDAINESQVVCPACGTDPRSGLPPESDPETAAAFEDGEAFAEAPCPWLKCWKQMLLVEQEVDYYVPIPIWS